MCPCHGNIEEAVEAHRSVVASQARKLSSRYQTTYDDVYSDGLLALWKALEAFDESRGMPLGRFLNTKVWFGMVDGVRSRTNSGAGLNLVPLEEIDQDPKTLDFVEAVELRQDTLPWLRSLAEVDERLPQIVLMIGYGYTYNDIGGELGITQGRVRQLVALVPGKFKKSSNIEPKSVKKSDSPTRKRPAKPFPRIKAPQPSREVRVKPKKSLLKRSRGSQTA